MYFKYVTFYAIRLIRHSVVTLCQYRIDDSNPRWWWSVSWYDKIRKKATAMNNVPIITCTMMFTTYHDHILTIVTILVILLVLLQGSGYVIQNKDGSVRIVVVERCIYTYTIAAD